VFEKKQSTGFERITLTKLLETVSGGELRGGYPRYPRTTWIVCSALGPLLTFGCQVLLELRDRHLGRVELLRQTRAFFHSLLLVSFIGLQRLLELGLIRFHLPKRRGLLLDLVTQLRDDLVAIGD